MPAGPSQTNQNNLLVDSSKLPASSIEEAEEAEEAEEVEEAVEAVEAEAEAEEITTPMMTPMPSLLKPQMGSSTGRSQQYSQEIGK